MDLQSFSNQSQTEGINNLRPTQMQREIGMRTPSHLLIKALLFQKTYFFDGFDAGTFPRFDEVSVLLVLLPNALLVSSPQPG